RWQNAHDVAAELQWAREAASTAAQPSRRERFAWSTAAAAGIVAAIAVLLAVRASPRPPAPPAAPASVEQPLLLASNSLSDVPSDWSLDGRFIAMERVPLGSTRGGDIWLVSPDGHDARPLIDTDAHEAEAVLSPDGNYLAYVSDETGGLDVYA